MQIKSTSNAKIPSNSKTTWITITATGKIIAEGKSITILWSHHYQSITTSRAYKT